MLCALELSSTLGLAGVKAMRKWAADIPMDNPYMWPDAAVVSFLAEFEVRPIPRPERSLLVELARPSHRVLAADLLAPSHPPLWQVLSCNADSGEGSSRLTAMLCVA